MPPAIIAALPLILGIGGAATGATELGMNLAGVGKPSAASPYPTTAQVGADKAQLASVVRQGLPNQQEAGGGGLSPAYDASMIGTTTGTGNQPNQLQDIVNQILNGSGGGTGGGASLGGSPSPNFASLGIPSQPNSSLSGGPGLADTQSIFGGGS